MSFWRARLAARKQRAPAAELLQKQEEGVTPKCVRRHGKQSYRAACTTLALTHEHLQGVTCHIR